jgi:hypothetical protein
MNHNIIRVSVELPIGHSCSDSQQPLRLRTSSFGQAAQGIATEMIAIAWRSYVKACCQSSK